MIFDYVETCYPFGGQAGYARDFKGWHVFNRVMWYREAHHFLGGTSIMGFISALFMYCGLSLYYHLAFLMLISFFIFVLEWVYDRSLTVRFMPDGNHKESWHLNKKNWIDWGTWTLGFIVGAFTPYGIGYIGLYGLVCLAGYLIGRKERRIK